MTLVEKDVVVGVGVAVPMPVEVAGVGVWLGVWVTLGAVECEGVGDSVRWLGVGVEAGVDGVWLCVGVTGWMFPVLLSGIGRTQT